MSDQWILVPPKGKTKEVGLVGRCHLAFILVDFKLELSFKEALNTCHHPFACPLRLHQDDKVVRIADEPVATAFEFLVQVIQEGPLCG